MILKYYNVNFLLAEKSFNNLNLILEKKNHDQRRNKSQLGMGKWYC